MDIEYTICQIQSGKISLAVKTHRKLGGNPQLAVDVTPKSVTWTLINLVDGTPETLVGIPRQNRIDFYFLLANLRAVRSQLPVPTVRPNFALHLPPLSSVGSERPGGKPVHMVSPAYRYAVLSVELFVTQPPSFHSIGTDPFLHMDIESTPSQLYGTEILEVHFGIQAKFDIVGQFPGTQSRGTIVMEPETYATIFSDIMNL